MRAKRVRDLRERAGFYKGDPRGKNPAFILYKKLKRLVRRGF